jgi:hypothetical protein
MMENRHKQHGIRSWYQLVHQYQMESNNSTVTTVYKVSDKATYKAFNKFALKASNKSNYKVSDKPTYKAVANF